MKAVTISLIIFFCIIFSGVAELIITQSYMKTLTEYTDKIENAVQENDIGTLESELKNFSDKWKKMRFNLSLIIKHELLFDIDNGLLQLEKFLSAFDSTEAMLSVSQLRASISCVKETSAFSIENII